MDTNSNEENEKLTKRKPKIRPSAEPSISHLQAQELINKQQVHKTDSDSSSSTIEASDGEQKHVDENENNSNMDKKSLNNTPPKDTFVTTHHGLPNEPKCISKFRCKVCDGIFNSTKEWNHHYESNYPLLTCDDCDKTFRNLMSLYRHRYTHTKTENMYSCPQCTCVFPLSIQL